ncbi:tRNA 2-thiocytidine biosynthesis TtcA family protein [Dendrosporobacter sp. 1207_IL3150]|uniref:tRNA 2-thiocytidine biosynthesis TtcA family protein n=1 Tax=Dendrosporobacter sp. 1207_IL3150 TaxID=3084054 RepID=UPI002FD91465
MKRTLPQYYFSRLMRAIVEFDLISEGDKILIGLSGGKDSIFLTYALSILRKYSPRNFEIAAITLDPMFTEGFDTQPIADFCDSLDIPYYTRQVNVAGAIENNGGKDPCFTCSFFRRGTINNFAIEHGFNKIAYAHHNDDAVETFFMSLMYSGQLKTFLPKTYLDRTNLTVIRPLIYFREDEIRAAINIHGFTPLPSPCPLDGKTKRQEVKETIRNLQTTNKALYKHLAAAMRQSAVIELWPDEPAREELKVQYLNYMKKPN